MRIRGVGHLFLPKYRRRGETAYRTSMVWWWKGPGGVRLSTGCHDETAAQRWVVEHLAEAHPSQRTGGPLRWDDLERMIEDRYRLEGRRSLPRLPHRLRHLRRVFAGCRAQDITSDRVTAYLVKRRGEGAAIATCNVEAAILHRCLALAHEAGKLDRLPVLHKLPGATVRQGFLEPGDFEAILERVPWRYQPLLDFLRLTGWREAEALGLTWQRVNLKTGELLLETSKNGCPRTLCFDGYTDLERLLDQQHHTRTMNPYVFPGRDFRPLNPRGLEKAWEIARKAAGLPDKLIHDLRRTLVRDMERAGVSRSVAMTITGHKSETVYRRYAIVARVDQTEGLRRLADLRAGEPVQQRLLTFGGVR